MNMFGHRRSASHGHNSSVHHHKLPPPTVSGGVKVYSVSPGQGNGELVEPFLRERYTSLVNDELLEELLALVKENGIVSLEVCSFALCYSSNSKIQTSHTGYWASY